jgi:hypothetical protein
MATVAFASLKYASKLCDAAGPASRFRSPRLLCRRCLSRKRLDFCAQENSLTRDHFTEVLNTRFGEFGVQMDARFAGQDAKFFGQSPGTGAGTVTVKDDPRVIMPLGSTQGYIECEHEHSAEC